MQMKNPTHPGRIVRDECLAPLGLTVTEGARVLGVSRQALNHLVNEKAAISAEMAVRLAMAFGSTAETWLYMQVSHDLARIFQSSIHVKSYRKASSISIRRRVDPRIPSVT
jgi:antitoxin HigA-1